MSLPLSTDAVTNAPPDTTFDLRDKVVWVTGASGGIGSAIARRSALAGARLVLQSRTVGALESLAESLAESVPGAEIEIVPGSVTDAMRSDQAVDVAMQRWGRLDGLVASAGVSPFFKAAEDIGIEEWRELIETNLTGTFVSATAAGRAMLAAGSGSIVILSSVHGTVATPRLAAYAASKGAVNMYAKSLATEWATRGVRVNVLAPGYVETDMTNALRTSDRWGPKLRARVPMGRFARPDEISGAAQFLLSDESSYMTGSVVEIDGGWSSQ